MEDNVTILKLLELIERVNSYPEINESGLKNTDFPDRTIASLHNHLGNMKQYISGISTAFNATEQSLMIKNAEKDLNEVGSDLFELHQRGAMSNSVYSALNVIAKELEELLSKQFDSDFS